MYETTKKEKALLIVVFEKDELWQKDDLSNEFRNLVLSTGIEVVDLMSLRLSLPNPSLYIGKGKAEEIAILASELEVNTVIFNNNLNFTQQRNLEDILGFKTLDRTQLILDIFAQHAQTQEGVLQVELAQLEYMLPRLRGKGIMLSRLGGGIGTRGPGEKKLEIDRRRISERIARLKKELELIKQHRTVMRKKRKKEGAHVFSLVGYTNAGKTTLFNAICDSQQRESNSLFTTLDTVSRAFSIHNKLRAVLSDTVGFIHKLPPNLIESFKATLEELHYADVLLHVIDSSSKNIIQIKDSVESILRELGLDKKPTIKVFNKIDKLNIEEQDNLIRNFPDALFVSAKDSLNLDVLAEKFYQLMFKDRIEVVVRLPFDKMEKIRFFHNECEVLKTSYQEKEAVFWVKMDKQKIAFLKKQGLTIKEL